MLKRGDYLMIEHKHDDGVYIKDIAEGLGVHPRTVSRALKRGAARPGNGRGPGGVFWTRTSRRLTGC